MHISMVTYQHKPEKWDEMVEFGKSVIPELRKIPGYRQIVMVRTGESTSATFGIYDSQEQAEAATPKVREIFGRMAEFLTAPPERQTADIDVFDSV